LAKHFQFINSLLTAVPVHAELTVLSFEDTSDCRFDVILKVREGRSVKRQRFWRSNWTEGK